MFIRPCIQAGNSLATLLNGLVSWWRMEELTVGDRADAHGSNDLSNNGVFYTTTGLPGTGTAASYTSVNSRGTKTAPHGLHGGARDYTLAAWVYFISTASDRIVLTCGNPANPSTTDYMLYLYEPGPSLGFFVGNGASWAVAYAAGAITMDAWNCVVCRHDASAQEISIELNGATPVVTTGVTTPNTSGQSFYVSGQVDALRLQGHVDEVCFASRIWTPAESEAYHNSGNGITYTDI